MHYDSYIVKVKDILHDTSFQLLSIAVFTQAAHSLLKQDVWQKSFQSTLDNDA
jgi:hypothetical protein